MTISVMRSFTVSAAPGSSRWMMPVPGCESACANVYLSVSLNFPAFICSKASTISGILMVLIVSI